MQRAYVVQLSAECGEGKPIRGRVEHVRSGDYIRFENVDELVDFLIRSLASETFGPSALERG